MIKKHEIGYFMMLTILIGPLLAFFIYITIKMPVLGLALFSFIIWILVASWLMESD
jgi:hypothetical protein